MWVVIQRLQRSGGVCEISVHFHHNIIYCCCWCLPSSWKLCKETATWLGRSGWLSWSDIAAAVDNGDSERTLAVRCRFSKSVNVDLNATSSTQPIWTLDGLMLIAGILDHSMFHWIVCQSLSLPPLLTVYRSQVIGCCHWVDFLLLSG